MSEHTWKLWYSHHARERNDCYSRSLRFVSKLWETLGLTHVAIVTALVAYALLGGLVFYWIEAPAERQRDSELTMAIAIKRQEIAKSMFQYVANCTRNTTDCSMGMEDIIEWYEKETEPLRMAQPGLYNWGNYWNAVWYASTVFTTIGYGNLACKTFAGRLITIFYALIGIPLTLVVLNDIGQLMFRKLTVAYVYIRRKLNRSNDQEAKVTSEEVVLPLWIAVAIILIYAFIAGAVITITEDGWTFFDGMYFMFVSVATIGFGDVMPADPQNTVNMSIIFLIGLSLISLCFSIVNSRMEQHYRQTMTNIQATIDKDDKDHATATFQSIIYTKRQDTVIDENDGFEEDDKTLKEVEKEVETILAAQRNFPGISLGVLPSRSPSLRRPSH